MCFVIQEELSKGNSFQNDDFIFDADQYNYLINKRVALSNKSLINNPQQLEYVLQQFEEIDPIFLDQLQYFYTVSKEKEGKTIEKKITVLHIALGLDNSKSINMILKYLSKLDYSSFDNI